MSEKYDNLIGKSVVCSLPYLIYVEDGFQFLNTESKEKKNDFPDAYVVKISNDIQVGIQFCKRINKNVDSGIQLHGEIKSDRAGKSGYSSVKVNFLLKQISRERYFDLIYFPHLAVIGINKFIQQYKAVTKKYHIYNLASQTIQNFTTISYFKDGTSSNQFYADTNGPLYGLGGSIPIEQDIRIRSNLLNDIEVSIVDQIHLDVLDKIGLEEYRLSIIESAIMFETWLNIFLRKKLKKQGFGEKEIDKKIFGKGKIPLSAYNLAENLITKTTKFNFSKVVEFDNWCNHTKDVRNSIVHGKKYHFKKEEAILAYHSAIEAINIVEEAVHKIENKLD